MIALVFLVAESDPLLLPGDEFSFQPGLPASAQFDWSRENALRNHLLDLTALKTAVCRKIGEANDFVELSMHVAAPFLTPVGAVCACHQYTDGLAKRGPKK
jgi:hypothetical protein